MVLYSFSSNSPPLLFFARELRFCFLLLVFLVDACFPRVIFLSCVLCQLSILSFASQYRARRNGGEGYTACRGICRSSRVEFSHFGFFCLFVPEYHSKGAVDLHDECECMIP